MTNTATILAIAQLVMALEPLAIKFVQALIPLIQELVAIGYSPVTIAEITSDIMQQIGDAHPDWPLEAEYPLPSIGRYTRDAVAVWVATHPQEQR